jgi:hypothetical protein
MKRIASTIIVFVLFAGLPARAQATVSASANWALITLQAGPRGASGTAVIGASTQSWGTGPMLAGFAVDRAHGGTVLLDHTEGGEHRYFAALERLRPAEVARFVVFIPGGRFRALPRLHSKPSRGEWTATVRTSSGARAIRILGATGNPGFGTGRVPSGRWVYRETTRTGVFGAQLARCEACTGEWTAPDGRTGRWVAHEDPVGARPPGALLPAASSFRGPPGAWTWNWDGVVAKQSAAHPDADPVIAVIVPVGSLWKQFG